MPAHDERTLIDRAKRGDREAIAEIYDRHVDRIYRYVRYRIVDGRVAEDITADVFLKAIESLDRFDERGVPFIAWLYRIAHARVIDYWRRLQRRPEVEIDDPTVQEVVFDEEDANETDVLQHRSLLKAVQHLTDEQQQVITLHFREGLSMTEIAQIMDKTEGAIKALQRRALEALARILEE